VHAYGKAKVVQDEEMQLAVLKKMVRFYDQAYIQQWENLPMDYKLKMIKGIVAFDITITDLQAKKKLSQNRTDQEKEHIISSLKNSPDANEQEIAAYMQANR
jgi:transcriptional regulator